ncbi:TIGR02281 family clan AA aspartic protease [Ensifer soli]|uniref:TIGR02281 family clan AA aspartic protease n=1 Tax=Ciceribacter sp. sgz301302 TaxID=3342379 RepID=UPI0035B7AF1A
MIRLGVLLAILGVGLVLLVVNDDTGRTFGMDNDDFARAVSLTAILTLIGAGLWRGQAHLGVQLRQAALWILIALALVTAYVYRDGVERIGATVFSGLVPGRATVITDSEGVQEVVLHKMLNGHFEADTEINGTTLSMLVDTGASAVVLSYEDALRIGVDPASLSFTVPVMTANGSALAAPVTLPSVAIGPIFRENVRAVVAERGRLDQSLLGMTFLSTLDFLQMRTDELRLRD